MDIETRFVLPEDALKPKIFSSVLALEAQFWCQNLARNVGVGFGFVVGPHLSKVLSGLVTTKMKKSFGPPGGRTVFGPLGGRDCTKSRNKADFDASASGSRPKKTRARRRGSENKAGLF